MTTAKCSQDSGVVTSKYLQRELLLLHKISMKTVTTIISTFLFHAQIAHGRYAAGIQYDSQNGVAESSNISKVNRYSCFAAYISLNT